MAGLQCLRRLWLLVHDPMPYEEPAPGSLLDIGQEIGRKAHLLFPGGIEVTEEPWEHAQAVARTATLMTDANVPAIFEAAFGPWHPHQSRCVGTSPGRCLGFARGQEQ